MTPPRRIRKNPNEFHHGDLRRALVDAMLDLVNKGKSPYVTMRAVAQRAGVSHAAAYRHYRSQDDLLAAVAARCFDEMRERITATIAPLPDPLDRFHRIGFAYVEFARSSPSLFRLMYGPQFARREEHPALQASARAAFAGLLETVKQCHERGLLRDGNPVEQALTGWSLAHGLAMLIVDGQLADAGIEVDALVRTALETMRAGIKR